MARQGVITTSKTTTVTRKFAKHDDRNSNGHRIVHVPAHTRMVNGKPVFVAGYSYVR